MFKRGSAGTWARLTPASPSQVRTASEQGPSHRMEETRLPERYHGASLPSWPLASALIQETRLTQILFSYSVWGRSCYSHSLGRGSIFYVRGWPPTQHRDLHQRVAPTRLLCWILRDHFDNKRKNANYQKKPTGSGWQQSIVNHAKNRNGSHTHLVGFKSGSQLCDLGHIVLPPWARGFPSVKWGG